MFGEAVELTFPDEVSEAVFLQTISYSELKFVNLANNIFSMKTYIELKNMRFYAYHGVLPAETIIGNDFAVNLKLKADFSAACESDDVRDTVNYAEVYDIVQSEMKVPSKLLEHVAGRIFSKLKEVFPDAEIVELRVAKKRPPVNGEVDWSEITLME